MTYSSNARHFAPFQAILRHAFEPAYHVFIEWTPVSFDVAFAEIDLPLSEQTHDTFGPALCGMPWVGQKQPQPNSHGSMSAHAQIRAFICHACEARSAELVRASVEYTSLRRVDVPTVAPPPDAVGYPDPPAPRPAYLDAADVDPEFDWSFAEGEDVVYGRSLTSDDGFVFLPRSALMGLVDLHAALAGEPTWGDLRDQLDGDALDEILERASDGLIEADLPLDTQVADIPASTLVGRVSGFDDSEWPDVPEVLVHRWVPTDIAEYYCKEDVPRFSSEQLVVGNVEAFIAGIQSVGGRCERDDDLVGRAY